MSTEAQTAGQAEASWAETENLLDSAEDLIEAIREAHRQGQGLAMQRKLVDELRAELQELVGVPTAQAAPEKPRMRKGRVPGVAYDGFLVGLRKRLGLTQDALAKKSGCSAGMIAVLETGHGKASPALLARIQKALGVAAGS